MFGYVFDRVENIVGKGENAGNRHFLLFPKCFQKASYLGFVKFDFVWDMRLLFMEFMSARVGEKKTKKLWYMHFCLCHYLLLCRLGNDKKSKYWKEAIGYKGINRT